MSRARKKRRWTKAVPSKPRIFVVLDAVSEAEIMAARTPAGGWTRAQLAQWGVPWPPPTGWKQSLITNFERQRYS